LTEQKSTVGLVTKVTDRLFVLAGFLNCKDCSLALLIACLLWQEKSDRSARLPCGRNIENFTIPGPKKE
jgi:hypothetical protein